jgi:amino acid transporter
MQPADAAPPQTADFGLRRGILSPLETLAQSVSTMGPTTSPAATIPLVWTFAGNGTWLAYGLATAAVVLIALCIAEYARHSASPGSLYTYASATLPAWLSALVAWSLLLAYVTTASSVIGGFYYYANLLFFGSSAHVVSAVLLSLAVTGISIWIAYRDVQISARLMLWIEAVSVSVIIVVVGLVLIRHGWRWDGEQLHLSHVTGSGLRLGLVLALFSFVGFESATTLGTEARDPLRSIPRAVIQCSLLAGAFFTLSAYAEVLGFRGTGQDLAASQSPMSLLARQGGVAVLGWVMDVGALISLFACTLACITAAARVLLRMAHDGLALERFKTTHSRNRTPTSAVVLTGTATVLPVAILAARGAGGMEVYGWLGALATYGFIVAYALICLALPRYLAQRHIRDLRSNIISVLAAAAMLLALVGNLYPLPEGPYGKLPIIYVAYLAAGMAAFFLRQRGRKPALAESLKVPLP